MMNICDKFKEIRKKGNGRVSIYVGGDRLSLESHGVKTFWHRAYHLSDNVNAVVKINRNV